MHHLTTSPSLLLKLALLSLVYVKSLEDCNSQTRLLISLNLGGTQNYCFFSLLLLPPTIFSMFHCYLVSVNFVLLN